MNTIDPMSVSTKLYVTGYWYTYWILRNEYKMTRLGSLWLIWVGRCYSRHRDRFHATLDV